jgi:hypothetical protein
LLRASVCSIVRKLQGCQFTIFAYLFLLADLFIVRRRTMVAVTSAYEAAAMIDVEVGLDPLLRAPDP